MTETELLYPTCPDCGNKASNGNGVDGFDALLPTFEWHCMECQRVHTGEFNVPPFEEEEAIEWNESRDMTFFERCKHRLF